MTFENKPQEVFLIDRGEKDGIKEEMPVVEGDIFLGKILKTFPDFSKVLLITDPSFKMIGKILEKETTGLIKGNYQNLEMEMIPQGIEIKENEIILTSNLEKNIPSELIIGQIKEIKQDPFNQMFQKAIIKPFFKKENLGIIGVIKD